MPDNVAAGHERERAVKVPLVFGQHERDTGPLGQAEADVAEAVDKCLDADGLLAQTTQRLHLKRNGCGKVGLHEHGKEVARFVLFV